MRSCKYGHMHSSPSGSLEHWRSWCDFQRAATSEETATRMIETGWNVDVSNAARKIKCPVLILHSEGDQVVPIEEGRALVSLIPGSRFIEIDSENHMPLADEPAWPRVVSDIRNFLARIRARASRPRHCRSRNLRRVSSRSSRELPTAWTMRSWQHHSAFRRKRSETISHVSSTKPTSSTVTRQSCRARDAGLGASSRLTRAR